MGLGTAHRAQTPSNVNGFRPTLYTPEMLENETKNLVAAALFWNRDNLYDGQSVAYILPKGGRFTAAEKALGSAVSYQDPASDPVTLTINQYWYNARLKEDTTDATTMPVLDSSDIFEMQYDVDKKFDSDILSLYPNLTLTTEAAGTDTGDNLLGHLRSAKKKLDIGDVPSDRRVIIGSATLADRMLSIDQFISGDYVTGKPMENGFVGRILGFDVFTTTNTPATTVSSVTTDHCFIGHQTAYSFMSAFGPRLLVDRVPEYVGWQTLVDRFWGKITTYPARGLDFTVTV